MRTTDSGPLGQLQDALSELTQVDPRDVSDESVRSALPALLTAFHQLAAVVSGVVGAFDARDLSELDACRTAKTWLESFGRMTPHAASAWVRWARLLGELPRTTGCGLDRQSDRRSPASGAGPGRPDRPVRGDSV